jgi:hypothetical protein
MSISQPRLPHYHALPLDAAPHHSIPLHSTPIHTTPLHSLSLISRAPSPPAPALARIVLRRRRAIHYSLPMPDVAAHRRPLHRTVSLSRCTSSIPSMPSSPRFPCHHRLGLHAIIALHVIINITRDFTIASSSIRAACPSLETCLVSAPPAFPPPRLHILQLSDGKLDRFQVRFANLFFPRRHHKPIQPILMAQQHLVGFGDRPLRKHLSPTLAHI